MMSLKSLACWALATSLLLVGASPAQAQTGTVLPNVATKTISTTTCPGAGCWVFGIGGAGTSGIEITGTFVGTITFSKSVDGVTWSVTNFTIDGGAAASTTAVGGHFTGDVSSAAFIRVAFTAYTSGSAVATRSLSSALAVSTTTISASQSGTWTVQIGNTPNTTAILVAGGKTNDAAIPGATNVGALTCVALNAAPTYTTTNLAFPMCDLKGALSVILKAADGTVITPSTLGQQNVAITLANITGGFNLGYATSAELTPGTTARPTVFIADLVGKQIVLPYANPENFVSGVITSAMTGTTSTSLVGSPGGSLRNYLTQCTFSNSHATVGTDMLIQDGNGGTTLYVVPTAPAFGGAVVVFPTPLRQPTTATAIYVANVTTGSNTKASCSGYKGV